MIAFEITSLDVRSAVKKHLGIELTLFEADRVFNGLDLEKVSDVAAFESDGDGGTADDDVAMDEAMDRAAEEIVRQVNARSLIK